MKATLSLLVIIVLTIAACTDPSGSEGDTRLAPDIADAATEDTSAHSPDAADSSATGDLDGEALDQDAQASDATATTTYVAYSTSDQRTDAVPLEMATVSGAIFVFLGNDTDVDEVDFYIDDPQRAQPPLRSELDPPFDLQGATPSAANPWDTEALADGQHTVSMAVRFFDGTGEVVHATFSVDNSATGACGDGTCGAGEDTSSCPQDCTGSSVCGDGTCESGETSASCPLDCPCTGDIPAGPHNTGLLDASLLTPYTGPMHITSGTHVIENKEIVGMLDIDGGSDVTLRNVWAHNDGGFWTIYTRNGTLLIEDSEIGKGGTAGQRAIGGSNVTARRVSIHHHEDGIKLGSNALYDTVWVHDLDSNSADPHADALQAEGSVDNSEVRNSTLDARWAADSSRASSNDTGGANAAVILKTDFGPQSNVTFNGVYLNGGNYVVFLREGGNGAPTGIRFEGCMVGPDRRYGVLSSDATDTYWDVVDASTCDPI